MMTRKWNGPDCVLNRRSNYRHCRAQMGKGDLTTRMSATAYVCRFQGFFPKTEEEFCRLAGVPK